MTHLWFEPETSGRLAGIEVDVHRQPVLRPDRSVYGYTVDVRLRAQRAYRGQPFNDVAHAAYMALDLSVLVGADVAFIGGTTGMLTGDLPLPFAPGGLVLEVPGQFANRADAASHLRELRAAGVGLSLAEYTPGGGQDDLVPLFDFVKVDLVRGPHFAELCIDSARERHVRVVAERVDTEGSAQFCLDHGVDLLQGPLFQRDASPLPREFTVSEVQCLELITLLSTSVVDQDHVVEVICSDPELVIRVLRLVNSSAYGGRSRVDTVRRAVVLLGPRLLVSLAMASLVGARDHTMTGLWYLLSRAVACRTLARDEIGYTVGLLSAVAAQLRVAPADLVARAGVSADVGDAVVSLSGRFGRVLAAVLAHEENDRAGVEATGLAPSEVSDAYLDAVGRSLGTAAALVDSRS